MNLSLPDICARAFLGRWDKALKSIAILFAVSLLFIYVGKQLGVLFLPANLTYDFLTGVIATLIAVLVGVARKNGWI